MSIYEAFVYEWTNNKNGMKYIGSHKGNQNDGYVSSSKYLLEDYKKDPQSFTRKILAFGTTEEMRSLETEMLQEVDACNNPLYYNKHNQNGKFLCLSHTEETKKKMLGRVPWNKGKKGIYSEETKKKMKAAKQDYIPWNLGVSPSDQTKEKLSEYKGSNHHFYGKKRPDHSEKMKLSWEKRRLKNV